MILSDTVHAAGLVPCGGDDEPFCTKCHIFVLIQNIVNYLANTLVPLIATLLVVIGGFMMLLGGAKPAMFAKGKELFWNVMIGLLIFYSAWMITNTILRSLAGEKDPFKAWNQIECSESIIQSSLDPAKYTYGCLAADNKYACATEGLSDTDCSSAAGCEGKSCTPMAKTTCGTSASGSTLASAQLAQEILSTAGIGASSAADCPGFNAINNLNEMANGQLPNVCSPTCSCVPGGTSGTVTVNSVILEGMLSLNQWMKENGISGGFTITSLTTGQHSAGSAHYQGRAVDIVLSSGNPTDSQRARDFLNGFGGSGTAFCEDSAGKAVSDCSTSDHIHWQL
ncbi:MAG: pilin [bacterium]|nr:pilin [bacterium]